MSQRRRESALLRLMVSFSIGAPWLTIAVWACLSALAAGGMALLRIDTSTGSFLDRESSDWKTYQRSIQTFGGDEFIAVSVRGDHAFDRQSLRDVLTLSSRFREIAGVRRVDSLATVPLIRRGADGELEIGPGLTRAVLDREGDRREFAEAVRSDKIAPGALISRDERSFALNVVLDGDTEADRARTVSAVRDAVDGKQVHISGVPVFRTEVNARTESELLLFVPLTLVLIGAVLAFAFRQVVAVVVPCLIGLVATLVSLGVMGFVGTTLSLSTLILPSVLLALAAAYTIHVMSAASGMVGESLREAVVKVAVPVAYSGLTTVIGFLAMATVPISAIRELATYGAIGVLGGTAAVLTLAPAILALAPLERASVQPDRWIRTRLREWLAATVVSRRRWVIAAWALSVFGFGFGLSRLVISTDIINWFPSTSPIRADYEKIREELSGITPVNVVVESKSGESLTTPAALRTIGALSDALAQREAVGRSLSVVDPIVQMNRVITGSDVIPSDPAAIEQYLLLLSGADYLGDVISKDRSKANILLRLNSNSSDEIVQLAQWVREWWKGNGDSGLAASTTGIMYEFGRAEESIAYGQLRGLALALVVVALVLRMILGSLSLVTKAVIPNIAPVIIVFGTMGILGIPLDAATVCLGSLALGIAVDDTIHVMVGYAEAKGTGLEEVEAVDVAMERVLPALILTSIALVIGFGVLGISGFTLVRNLGLMTSGLVFVCLLADTTLLPALLVSDRAAGAE